MGLRRNCLAIVACVSLGLVSTPADAETLTWGGANIWSLGDTSNAYLVNASNVTITISDPDGAFDGNTEPLASPGAPQTSAYIDPTGNGGAESLFIKTPNNTSAVTITLAFDSLVTDVSIATYDIDRNPPGDYIDVMSAVATDGVSFFDPASVTGNGSESWTLQGDGQTIIGTGNADQTGGNSANGTANWFFDDPINSITFTYTNGDPLLGVQWTSFSTISFTPLPEPGTAVLFAGGLLGLAAYGRRTRSTRHTS